MQETLYTTGGLLRTPMCCVRSVSIMTPDASTISHAKHLPQPTPWNR